jgi:hypothetical protein
VEKDGSKAVLHDADGSVRREIFEEPRLGERHQFRFIVSPEDAAQLNLTGYVRRLMAQVERDLGRRVNWAAVNHYRAPPTRTSSSEGWTGRAVSCASIAATSRTACARAPRRSPPNRGARAEARG